MKKIAIILTFLLVFASLFVFFSSAHEFLYGDVTDDGKVNSADAVTLDQYMAGWSIDFSEDEKKAADVYTDGKINMKDLVILSQYVAGWSVTLGNGAYSIGDNEIDDDEFLKFKSGIGDNEIDDDEFFKFKSGIGDNEYDNEKIFNHKETGEPMNHTIYGKSLSDFKITTAGKYNTKKLSGDILGLTGVNMQYGISDNAEPNTVFIDNTSLDYAPYSVSFTKDGAVLKGSYRSIEKAVEAFKKIISEKEYVSASDNVSASIGRGRIYTKSELMQVLTDVYGDPDHSIIGEEAIPYVSDALTHFKNGTGEAPGMIGIDLTPYGMDLKTETPEMWSRQLCEIVEFCEGGGILCVSSHFTNPSGNIPEGLWQHPRGNLGFDNSREGYNQAFVDLVTKGTEINVNFQSELDIIGRFLKAIKDNNIPVLYRPLHEMNGYWFWWNVGQKTFCVDAENFTNLWKYIYNFLVGDLGLDNMLWVYAPDISSKDANSGPEAYEGLQAMHVMYCYPGDDYVDIGGVDWYTSGKGKLEITHMDSYKDVERGTGKICAITETGARFGASATWLKKKYPDYYPDDLKQVDVYNSMDYFDDLMALRDKGYSFAYILTWINQWSFPYLGKGEEFMAQPYTLGQKDVKAMFDRIMNERGQ